jgi:hypothetical protein
MIFFPMISMRNMKGQAAMEYLMTYGWAIVALVIVIAALMATGVFNPSYMVSEECTMQPDLSCGNYVLYTDNTNGQTYLMFRVDNGLGYDIEIVDSGTATSMTTQGAHAPDWDLKPLSSTVIPQGKNATLTFQYVGTKPPLKGELMKTAVQLTYISCAPEVNPDCAESTPQHTISGRIVARAEEKN